MLNFIDVGLIILNLNCKNKLKFICFCNFNFRCFRNRIQHENELSSIEHFVLPEFDIEKSILTLNFQSNDDLASGKEIEKENSKKNFIPFWHSPTCEALTGEFKMSATNQNRKLNLKKFVYTVCFF